MKLWQKIFIVTLLMVIAAIDLTAILLLSNNHSLLVQREQQRAASEHEYLSAMIKDNTLYERLRQGKVRLTDQEVTAAIRSIFEMDSKKQAAGFSLYLDNSRVLSSTGLPAEAEKAAIDGLTASNGGYFLQIIKTEAGERMLVSSAVKLEGKGYILLTSSDVSEIFTLRGEQIAYVQQMSVVCALVAAGVLLLVVLRLMLPLRRINLGTKEIAQGRYEKRLKVKGHDEIAELAANMNLMAQAVQDNVESLEKVAEDRRRFIANLAHEMKTPLTSILGFADLLRVRRTVSESERRDYAGVIVEETRRLRALSGKLMELITVGSTELDWEYVELSELMSEVEASLIPIFKNNGMTLKVHVENVVVSADKELLKSLIYNLVDNAVKASKNGEEVVIAGRREDDEYCLAVRDYGIGIAKEELDKITEPFYMVDKSRSRKSGGAGLGLSLCAKIVEIHKAQLMIESEPRKGTTVYILFSKEALV